VQVIHAGKHRYLYLELDPEVVEGIANQLGFEFRLQDHKRSLVLDLTASNRQAPLLLFDAADPGNLGWFSRCQFYVDGRSGAVMQTPIAVANQKDFNGYTLPNAIRLQITKELPAGFSLPGEQPVNEQLVYGVLFNFLSALLNTGVGVCGGSVIRALAGRSLPAGPPR